MFFSGRMTLQRKKKLSFLTLFLLLSFPVSGKFGPIGDSGQAAPDTPHERTLDDVEIDETSSHVSGEGVTTLEDMQVDEQSPLVPGEGNYGDKVTGVDSPTQFNAGAPFSGLTDNQYRLQTNEAILRPLVNKSRLSFAIDFYMNNFDYQDSRGIYEKTFESNTGATGGSLNLSSDFYYYKGAVNLGLGAGAGFGYSTGKGIFEANGEASDMRFNLYSIPADFRLSMEVPLGRAVKFTAAAGPSAMFLIQNRSDRDAKEDGKTNRQFGYGYFAEGKLKLNLSYLMPDKGFEYYKFHEVSFMSVDLMVRTQDYSGFADDIAISGMSYGIGVTFEFL